MNRFAIVQSLYSKILNEGKKSFFLRSSRCFCKNVTPTETADDRKKYTKTIVLPNTTFPLRIEPTEVSINEIKVSQAADFSSLYEWQSESLAGEEFILHDGPPYANGDPHMGHAVNKILKDIILRDKILDGLKINYVPGWDCHGLPIELKAIKDKTENEHQLGPIHIREKARKFARSSSHIQMRAFRSWGLLANWKNCYFTFDTPYIENQLQQFYNLYKKGFIYRSFLPIYWSPSSRTALAEAELEYNQAHKSTCVVLRLKIQQSSVPSASEGPLYALIWTTTPWTLPSNAAIGYNPEMDYSLISIDHWDGVYIVASALVDQLEKLMETKVTVQNTFPGSALEGSTYHHPVKPELVSPFLPADFVSPEKGTGLVHIAPTHGHEDFALGRKHNLSVEVLVDKNGRFLNEAGQGLEGLDVLGLGGRAVRLLLEENILHTHKYIHSYPYDWRTKQPVIICASKQWFLNLDPIKPLASSFAADIPVFPESLGGKENLLAKINSRSYWCISRQRAWGVPIPIFFTKETDDPIFSKGLIDHYCKLLKEHGPDFWWTLNNAELCPANLAEEFGVKADEIGQLRRGTDILDIWLDSGLSWSAVLGGRTADLYLEGVDQCTGWFQSSLLTSVALKNSPPYKSIFVHGFVVDKKGNKMSKSIGNVMNPQEIVYGGKNKTKQPPLGADVLRWWVAGHTVQHSNIPADHASLVESQKEVQRLRGVLRHILGNLDGIDKIPSFPKSAKDISNCIVDRYMLHELYNFNQQITKYNKNYQFNLVRIAVNNFVANQLSAIYLNIVKDRMYCSEQTSEKRHASQIIFYCCLEVLLRAISPILPFLSEEICQHHDCLKDTAYFKRRSISPLNVPNTWNDASVVSDMDLIFNVKNAINKNKGNENTWNLHAVIRCGADDLKILKALNDADDDQLLELLQVRSLDVLPAEDGLLNLEVKRVESPLCLRCRRNSILPNSDICQRCYDVLRSENFQERSQAS